MSKQSKFSASSSSASAEPPYVLVVDDMKMIYRCCRALITKTFNGASVDYAADMDTAKNILEECVKNKVKLPDLILSDCDLNRVGSGKNGPDLLKELKADAKFKNIPVIMMSAAMDEIKEELIAAGAEEALEKPIQPEQVAEWKRFFA